MFLFEDGELENEGYVEINGVKYPVHMPTYKGKTPLSSENLNKMQRDLKEEVEEDIIKLKRTVLFEGDSKETEITLNEDSTNYELVAVLFRTNDYYRGSVLMESASDRKFSMIGTYIDDDGKGGILKIRISKLSGNKIVKLKEAAFGFAGTTTSSNDIYIYKVLGYNRLEGNG